MNQKGSVNIILVIIVILLLGVGGYFALKKYSSNQSNEFSLSEQNRTPSESKIISDLLASWTTTQSKFSVKAGESGTYNKPDKVQFISSDTLLVHYDDGLVDHTSVVQYKNDAFTELKNVGVLSTMSASEWQTLVKTYGNPSFSASNYTTSILRDGKAISYTELTKVPENVFVK